MDFVTSLTREFPVQDNCDFGLIIFSEKLSDEFFKSRIPILISLNHRNQANSSASFGARKIAKRYDTKNRITNERIFTFIPNYRYLQISH